jgi:lipopolysaccharide biosynthesis regulator YciM
LGKYALDKGAELGKEVGPKALETAREMFESALDRLRRDPKGEVIAGEFEQDPETYQKPVEKALTAEVQNAPVFAEQLKTLLARYEEEAETYAAAQGRMYKATVKGSGAIAQDHSVGAGAGGVAVGGDVHGSITAGAQDTDASEDER